MALIAQGRFREAVDLIREAMPFPSVCGRVCNHQCEMACTRGKVDEAVNIMALKRFVAEWDYTHRQTAPAAERRSPEPTGKKVAIVGAGPAGLTAARDLLRMGYAVGVFDSLSRAGGMMRVGIPPHRLPSEMLDWEIQQIIDEGVDLNLNTRVNDVPGLLERGYAAVLIATGAHVAKKLPLRDSNHPDNWMSLDLLRRVCLGEKIDLSGKRVVVLGGGNVALDTARTVLRLGASEVRMACLESRGEMPGFAWEIVVAEEEGIQVYPGRTFKEIVIENDRITGVRCTEVNFRGFKGGRPDIEEIPGTDHLMPADLVIWAIGQMPDFSFLPQDGSINTRYPVGIQSDENMMTTLPGVFVAGDVHRGVTFFVVDAIGEGHRAARSIDRYLRGASGMPEPVKIPMVEMDKVEIRERFEKGNVSRRKRVKIGCISVEERMHNFREVDLTLTEKQALAEAKRCLSCGVCSECLACEKVCPAGAILHDQQGHQEELDIAAILYAGDPGAFGSTLPQPNGKVYALPPEDIIGASATCARVLHELADICRPVPVAASPALGGELARIGVFICQCGEQIARVVDAAEVCQKAISLPNVVHAQVLDFSCSPEGSNDISMAVNTLGLNRVVLAACSCCSVNQVCFSCTYQRVRCKQNLGLFTYVERDESSIGSAGEVARFEFVNIREQCAWVHADDPAEATAKATLLVSSAVARSRAAPARLAGVRPVAKSALVIGRSKTAQACLGALARQGIAAQHIADAPGEVQRTGGQYVVHQAGQTWQASALVLAPENKKEFKKILLAFGRERRRPLPSTAWGG
ncbi:MAG: FAD-dependent oxidoreductase, partial [Chloroflexota bacterium]